MSQQQARRYGFGDDLPVAPIEPGTNILVAGATMAGARELALRLVAEGNADGDATLLVSTNRRGEKLVGECDRLCPGLDRSRFGVLDCAKDRGGDRGPRVESVSSPGDLTGLGIEFSGLYEALHRESDARIRAGIYSISTLLMYSDLRTVSRFVHTLGGRIASTDGLGVFLIDSTAQDQRVVNTITQFCDGRIDVRESADGSELRVRGLDGQPSTWVGF